MITPPSPDLPSYSTHSNDEDIVDFNLCDSDDDVFIQNYLTNQRFTMFDMGPNFNQHYIPATLNYRMQSERHQNENTVSQQLRRIDRAPIVRKGPKTHLPQDRYAIEKYISKVRTLYKAKRQMERKPGGSASNSVRQAKREERGTAKPKKYRVVGGDASPLSGSNIGHRMLANMGWKEGDSLGVNKDGMAEPIQVVIQSNRRGLGA
ncbi:G-patch domain-containing protein [Chlamydoabsidia padenii]|nr:G-patch domain-containing protein [Chlamydoabsidia padenii]